MKFNDKVSDFTLKPIKLKNNKTIFLLLAGNGAVCGVFESEEEAKNKITRIAANLNLGQINLGQLKPKPKKPNRFKLKA